MNEYHAFLSERSEQALFDMEPPPHGIVDFLEPPPFPQAPPYSSRPPSSATLSEETPERPQIDTTYTLPPISYHPHRSAWSNGGLSPAARQDVFRSAWNPPPASLPNSTYAEYDESIEKWQYDIPSIDSLKFLEMHPGNGKLTISLPDDSTTTISNLNVDVIAHECPLLAFSFESGVAGEPHASIIAPSRDPVVCFLRFLYTAGDYWDGSPDCPLLLHAQICRMAEVFEVPTLQVIAHANVIKETELSCSRPTPPPTLCETIRFIFEELSEQKPLVETMLHYCVSCFLYHGLGANEDFKQLTFELASFTQMLCWTSMNRGFEDEAATDIIRLPTRHKAAAPETKAALGDFLFDFHGVDSSSDLEENMMELSMKSRKKYPLARRPKEPYSSDESDDERPAFGFTLVHRPKPIRKSSGWVKCEDDADKSASETDSELEDAYWRSAQSASSKTQIAIPEASSSIKREQQYSRDELPFEESIREWEERKHSRSGTDSDGFPADMSDSFLTIKPSACSANLTAQEKGKQKEIKTEESPDSEWSLV